jgi:type II restriction/modification system DNA methylase subunit YeeA
MYVRYLSEHILTQRADGLGFILYAVLAKRAIFISEVALMPRQPDESYFDYLLFPTRNSYFPCQ